MQDQVNELIYTKEEDEESEDIVSDCSEVNEESDIDVQVQNADSNKDEA